MENSSLIISEDRSSRFERLGETNAERLQKLSEKLKKSDCSITARSIIEAYWNHKTDNGRPIRTKTCVAACCSVPNLLEKICCVFTSCFCCPITTAIASTRENKYQMPNEVAYQWENIQEGWAEMDISALSIPCSILATCNPSGVKEFVENLTNYYLYRSEQREQHDRQLKIHIKAYDYYTKMQKEKWRLQLDMPDKQTIIELYKEGYEKFENEQSCENLKDKINEYIRQELSKKKNDNQNLEEEIKVEL